MKYRKVVLAYLDQIVFELTRVFVEKENSQPITSWHVTLPSPQSTANYKALCTITRNLVFYKFWHARWGISASHLFLLQKKINLTSFCYQLRWPLARMSENQWLMLPLPMIMSAQSLAVDLKLLINFNPNQPKKASFILSSFWTFLQIRKLPLRIHLSRKIWRSIMNHTQQRPFL